MPLNPDAVGAQGDPVEIAWTSTDSLLYALSVGAGVADPTGAELEFTTENSHEIEQRSLPTQCVVLNMRQTSAPRGEVSSLSLVQPPTARSSRTSTTTASLPRGTL